MAFCLWHLDEWALAAITSRLNFYDLSCLLRASNSVLRHKLLRGGGVQSLQLVASSFGEEINNDFSLSPRMVVPKRIRLDNFHYFPSKLFSRLRYLSFVTRTNEWIPPPLETLPSTLTHLDWDSRYSRYNLGELMMVKLSDILPNLVFLSLEVSGEGRRTSTTFSATPLIESLPLGLQSLSLRLPVKDETIYPLYNKLPRGLTQLAIASGIGESVTLSASHFQVDLPETLTDLRLYHCSFKLTPTVSSFGWTKLERLHLSSVSTAARPFLPASLTWLEIEQKLTVREEVTHTAWPAKLNTFGINLSEPLMLLFPPSVTRIKNKRSQPNAIVWSIELNISKHIVYAEFPHLVLVESCLLEMPTNLLQLVIWDVNLDGSSIPEAATSIDDCSIREHFRASLERAHFSLFLRKHKPLQTLRYPVKIPPSMLSLELSGHHLGLNTLPLSLTRAWHVEIPSVQQTLELFELPPNLTSLGLRTTTDSPAMHFESLLKLAPNLKELVGGKFVLGSENLPYDPIVSEEADLLDSEVLLLPEDAEQVFFSRYPQILFVDTLFESSSLLSQCSQPFTAYKSCRMTGSFREVSSFFLQNGFQNIVHLEIMSEFSRKKDGKRVFPDLPTSLTELTAGPPISFGYLQSEAPWKQWEKLPRLKKITLYFPWFENNMQAPWNLPLISSLTQLNLHMNSQYFSVSDLPSHLDRVSKEEQLLSAASSSGLPSSSSSAPSDLPARKTGEYRQNADNSRRDDETGHPRASQSTTKCAVM